MEKKFHIAPILSVLCILVILAMIAVMFLPYGNTRTVTHYDEEGAHYKDVTISTNDFVWFPMDYTQIQNDYIQTYYDGYDIEFSMLINDIVTMPALLLVLGVVLCIVTLLKLDSLRGALSASALGIYSAIGYATSHFWALGINWNACLITSFIATGVGLISLVILLIPIIKKKIAEKKERDAAYLNG